VHVYGTTLTTTITSLIPGSTLTVRSTVDGTIVGKVDVGDTGFICNWCHEFFTDVLYMPGICEECYFGDD
jgi:hypothetical protein